LAKIQNLTPRAVFATAGMLVALVIAGTAAALWLYRSAALASGEWHLRNIALVLAEHAHQGFLTADIALRTTAEEYARESQAGAFAEQTFQSHLRRRVAELPQLSALLVIRPDGQLVVHSSAFPAPSVRYDDRDDFTAQRAGAAETPYFGVPVQGRVIGEWIHPVSRAIRNSSGEFLGVVSAAINNRYFDDIYRALEIGADGRVFLFRQDGMLLTGFPAKGVPLGKSFAGHSVFKAMTGVLRARGLVDDEPRLIAYHRVSDYPLLVAVSSATRHVLREWRQQSLYAGAAALAAIAVILAAALLLVRQARLAQHLTREVAATGRRWLEATEAAGHGVWEWDLAAGKTLHSSHYHEMLGYAAGEIPPGREGWLDLIHPEDREIAQRAIEACAQGRVEHFSSELRLRCNDGSWKWVLNRGMVVSRDAQGRALRMLGTITDVTEHLEAQQRLRESEARLNAIVESAMDAVVTVDQEQRIVLFNRAAEKIFRVPARGAPGHEAIGSSLDRFLPERYRAPHRAHVARFGRTGSTMRRMGENIVLAGLRADGEEFPIDASISQVEVGGSRYYTVILRDITERQKAAAAIEASHRELRELYGIMNEVREAERVRIARELHDELAQWLTALKMDVSWVAARVPRDMTRLMEKTDRMKQVVDMTVAAVRRIAADLRPVMIDDLGLIAAIENLLHEFSERSGTQVSLDAQTGAFEFRDPLATAIYRMVQEALTNVARHAAASCVAVSLTIDEDMLRVEVRDNGCGIDEAALRPGKSYGVLGIRERAQSLGGSARIYTAEAGGTVVEISIPVRTPAVKERAA
jgi:two-component system sensor kinase